MGDPRAHFQSFKATGEGWRRSFRDPNVVRVAHRTEDVFPLIEGAEAASKAGSWVALAISYEAAPAFDPALKVYPSGGFPLAWMAVFDEPDATVREDSFKERFSLSDWEEPQGSEQYRRSIDAIRAHIERGDTYQVNFTFQLHGRFSGNPFSCFRTIGRSQGAAFSAYLDIGSHRILSFSPEIFFQRRGDKLITRPMKGTMPRGRWLEEDDERAEELAASPKNRAENVMIVDLLRNDLGKVAVVGSVDVPDLFAVERLRRVLQMTSTVTATQRPGTTLCDILRALFPCGSVTGAPKVSTMAIIEELEAEPRGIYTGAIGLLEPSGDALFNVAIRTLVIEEGSRAASFGVGGGITWDSTVEGEYEECLLKARFLTEPWPEFELLETLALENGVYSLLDRHLSRARSSAAYFAFHWDERGVAEALERTRASHPSGRWRVRLLVDSDGKCRTEAQVLAEPTNRLLSVKFAHRPIDERDPLLFHKTTALSRYDEELARSQPCDDVIFWNARGEVTESTVANIVLESGGKRWTPPKSAGLLAGTFRDELIEKGELFERTISKQELVDADSFALINSVRGWMGACIE